MGERRACGTHTAEVPHTHCPSPPVPVAQVCVRTQVRAGGCMVLAPARTCVRVCAAVAGVLELEQRIRYAPFCIHHPPQKSRVLTFLLLRLSPSPGRCAEVTSLSYPGAARVIAEGREDSRGSGRARATKALAASVVAAGQSGWPVASRRVASGLCDPSFSGR